MGINYQIRDPADLDLLGQHQESQMVVAQSHAAYMICNFTVSTITNLIIIVLFLTLAVEVLQYARDL